MKSDDIITLTETAFKFGPFLFALLFTLWISRWTYKIYHAQKESTSKEKNTYRWIFVGTTIFGMLLVIVSVIWWWNYGHTSNTYVFRAELKNLKDYERVESHNLYFRSRWTGQIGEDIPQFHDEEFAIIQETPFHSDQKFYIKFSKRPDDRNPQTFIIKYEDNIPSYEIVWDESTSKSHLKNCLTQLLL